MQSRHAEISKQTIMSPAAELAGLEARELDALLSAEQARIQLDSERVKAGREAWLGMAPSAERAAESMRAFGRACQQLDLETGDAPKRS